jgi:hypothetical protein
MNWTRSKLGKRLIKAAQEARAFARGEADPKHYRVTPEGRSVMNRDFRFKLILAKIEVKHVERTPTGWQFSLELPGLGALLIHAPPQADIQVGDRLTLYTEVASAKPSLVGPTAPS